MRSSSSATLLKQLTSQKTCPKCVVITSPDRIRRERALHFLLNHFNPTQSPKPTIFSFGEQGRASPQAFLRDLEEPSLFDPTRFAILRSIESARAADLEPLSDFLRKDVPGVHILAIGASLPNVPTFKKVLDSHASLLSFDPLKGAELRRWIEREVATQGITGADDAVYELLSAIGDGDPEAIAGVIEKFALYLGDAQATRQALKALEPGRTTASDFELAETLMGSNRAASEALLVKLIAQGSSPFMLIGLLTKTFSSLYRIRVLLDKGLSPHEIKNSTGIIPWLFSKYLPLAQRSSTKSLEAVLEALMVADFKLKDRSLGPASVLSSVASSLSPHGVS